MQTIGVLGGLGPQATMDFEARFHREAQRRVPPRFNSGYPPMVVAYLRHPPILFGDDGRPRQPLEPDPRLFDAARRLGAQADFLVIPSNFPHTYRREIEAAAGKPVLDMIGLVLDEVGRRGWRRVGVLGFGEPRVYLEPLAARAVATETIDGELRDALDREIGRVMEGRNDAGSGTVAERAVAELRGRGADGVILGCTEIPILLGDAAGAPDCIHPLALLAAAAVDRALAG